MLIKSYGIYWNPDLVDWGSVGAGKREAQARLEELTRGKRKKK